MFSKNQLFSFLLSCIPIAELAMAVQATAVWITLENPMSVSFLEAAVDLYTYEIIFMHSAIFWAGKDLISKTKFAKIFMSVFLFVAYGMFIFPMIDKFPWIGWNYLLLNMARILTSGRQELTWYSDSELFKAAGIEAQAIFKGVLSMVKAFYFALLLPLVMSVLPFPDGALQFDGIKEILPEITDPKWLILCIKTMAVYFWGLVFWDLYFWIHKKFRVAAISK